MVGLLFFVYGLLLGSFYNVVIYRLPIGKPIHLGRSFCPNCNTQLIWKDLFPLLSYLFLKGKCAYCHQKISWRYPGIELLTGGLFLLAYLLFGLEIKAFLMISFWSMLLIVAMIDYDHMFVMDYILLFFSLIHLVMMYFMKVPWKDIFYGAVFGLVFYGLIYILSKMFYKREAFGMGDVTLITAIGLVLGPRLTLFTAMMAFYIGLFGILILKLRKNKLEKETEIPFGPYICIAAFVSSIYGQQLLYGLFKILGY